MPVPPDARTVALSGSAILKATSVTAGKPGTETVKGSLLVPKTSVFASGPRSAIPSHVADWVSDCPGSSVSLVVGWDAAAGSDSQIVVPSCATAKSAGGRLNVTG